MLGLLHGQRFLSVWKETQMIIDSYKLMSAMVDKNMSFEDLANGIGMSSATVYRVVNTGRTTPRTFCKLATVLGLDPEEVILQKSAPKPYLPKPQMDVDAIEEILKEKGLNYTDLANGLGISRQAVWKKVHGVRPRRQAVKEIAKLLEVEPNAIVKGEWI